MRGGVLARSKRKVGGAKASKPPNHNPYWQAMNGRKEKQDKEMRRTAVEERDGGKRKVKGDSWPQGMQIPLE